MVRNSTPALAVFKHQITKQTNLLHSVGGAVEWIACPLSPCCQSPSKQLWTSETFSFLTICIHSPSYIVANLTNVTCHHLLPHVTCQYLSLFTYPHLPLAKCNSWHVVVTGDISHHMSPTTTWPQPPGSPMISSPMTLPTTTPFSFHMITPPPSSIVLYSSATFSRLIIFQELWRSLRSCRWHLLFGWWVWWRVWGTWTEV